MKKIYMPGGVAIRCSPICAAVSPRRPAILRDGDRAAVATGGDAGCSACTAAAGLAEAGYLSRWRACAAEARRWRARPCRRRRWAKWRRAASGHRRLALEALLAEGVIM